MYSLNNNIFPDLNKEDTIVQLTDRGDRYYHTHDFYEIFYITNGNIKHSLNSETDELSMGDVVFLRPGDIHCFLREPDNACAHRDLALTVPLYEKAVAFFKYNPLSDHTTYAKVKIDIETLNKLETELQTIGNADAEKKSVLLFRLGRTFQSEAQRRFAR